MSEPVKNLPSVTKPPCNPVYVVQIQLPNGEKVCMPKLKGPTGAHRAGFEPVPNKLTYEEDKISPDQFKPAPPRDLKKLITGKAEYSCKTRIRTTEYETITRDISVPAGPPNEKAEATKARLEKAARDVVKTIHGCFDVRFVRFLPTAEEALKAKQAEPASKKISAPQPQYVDPCGPGGKWENRLLCSK